MQTILYIVRHGHSIANAQKFFTGHLDVELNDTGKRQAEYVKEYFKDKKIDIVYSSDLIRAYDTVKDIAIEKNIPHVKSQNLREINAGDWEGKTFDYLCENYSDFLMWRTTVHKVKTPNGESVLDLANRVFNEVTKIAKTELGKTVVIGTHATPIRALVAKLCYGSFENMDTTPWFPNCGILKLAYDGEKFTVLNECITEHLNGEVSVFPKNV